MAATLTLQSGPTISVSKGAEYTFEVLLDNSFTADGEVIDLTDYFSYLSGGYAAGVDAVADATWRYGIVGPGSAVAVTSTNVVIVAHHGSGADAADNPADAEDLSSVGALVITVWGKPALVSSWA